MLLTGWAELQGLICSGVRRDNDHTYSLLAELTPDTRRLHFETAPAEITLRYFTGRGPAA